MAIALEAFEKNWTALQVAEKFGISVREADRCKRAALEVLKVRFSRIHSELLSRERQHLDELFCKACQKDVAKLQDEHAETKHETQPTMTARNNKGAK